MPGWVAGNRPQVLATTEFGIVGLVVPSLPGVGDANLAVSTSTEDKGESGDIRFYVSINTGDRLPMPVQLLIGGTILRNVGACSGPSESVGPDMSYDNLDGESKRVALNAFRNDYSASPAGQSNPYVGDEKLPELYKWVQFREVKFNAAASPRVLDGKEYPYVTIAGKCPLVAGAGWHSDGSPHSRFSAPRVAIQFPSKGESVGYSRYTLNSSVSVNVAVGAESSATRFTDTPNVSSPTLLQWNSPSRGMGGEFSWISLPQLGVVFENSMKIRADNSAIYRSGVGLGLATGLMAWAMVEVYDLIALALGHARARRKRGP